MYSVTGNKEAVAKLLDHANDVDAFAKNAGPQSLRVDYLQTSGQLAFYTPDFFVRMRVDSHQPQLLRLHPLIVPDPVKSPHASCGCVEQRR